MKKWERDTYEEGNRLAARIILANPAAAIQWKEPIGQEELAASLAVRWARAVLSRG